MNFIKNTKIFLKILNFIAINKIIKKNNSKKIMNYMQNFLKNNLKILKMKKIKEVKK